MATAAVLPPTTNTLPHHHRTRLMRSTRKLGALLGTTPYVLDPFACGVHTKSFSVDDSEVLSGGMQERTSSESQRGPGPSEDVKTPLISKTKADPKAAKALPHPLVLRMQAAPLSPCDMRYLPPTPASAASFVSTTSNVSSCRSHGRSRSMSMRAPTSVSLLSFRGERSTTSEDRETLEVRRKRMAKLTRTLGENVPPELVFPCPAARNSPSSTHVSATPVRSASLLALSPKGPQPLSAHSNPGSVSSAELSKGTSVSGAWIDDSDDESIIPPSKLDPRHPSWTGEWSCKDMHQVQKHLRALKGH